MEKMQSIWEGTASNGQTFPVYSGDQSTEVVIIGGGITGLTAAYLLGTAGVPTILLEAHRIGLGTTGNSTGNLYATVDEHLSTIRKKWSDTVMKDIVNARSAALRFIEQMVTTNAIECNFSRQPFVFYSEERGDKTKKFIDDESSALDLAGLAPQILNTAGLPFETYAALRVDGQAQFHPLKYVRALAKMLESKCSIYEHSQVIDIDKEKGIVKTDKGTVSAQKIVMATHTPKGALGIHSVLGPYREFGVACELPNEFPGGIYWSMDAVKHSVRTLKDDKSYVMVVGDKFKTGQHGNSFEHIDGLANYLKERLPVAEPKFVWAGQQYRAADGLPYIGKADGRAYYLTGFATDGLVYGTLASMIVTDHILGTDNEWASTFDVSRFTPLKSAKAFLKENLDNAVQYLKDVPGNVDAKELKDIKAGEGKVMEHKGEKLAVYREDNGTLHTCSAVCTHMDCIVNWNPAERSWDCPCHGSRFNYDGALLEGPAITDLPKRAL